MIQRAEIKDIFTIIVTVSTLTFVAFPANAFFQVKALYTQENPQIKYVQDKQIYEDQSTYNGKSKSEEFKGEEFETQSQDDAELHQNQILKKEPKELILIHLQGIRDKNPHKVWRTLSPDYRAEFSSPGDYLRHVKEEKKPLFNHISYQMLHGGAQGKDYIQRVRIVTRGGRQILAIYNFSASKDGWGISRVTLLGHDTFNI